MTDHKPTYSLDNKWYVTYLDVPEKLKGKEKLITEEIKKKYPVSMYEEKWQRHQDCHQESGRLKCRKDAQPVIELKIIELKDCGLHTYIKMKGVLRALGKRDRMCYEGMGNININLPIEIQIPQRRINEMYTKLFANKNIDTLILLKS